MFLKKLISMYLDKIVDLRNLTSLSSGKDYVVAGYFKPGDGGEGTFVWIDDTAPPADDGGIIIRNTQTISPLPSGYFKRIYSGPINVRWFGAIMGATDPNPPIDPHTGSAYTQPIADVTPYVHAARDSKEFANNGTLYFPKGVYPGAFDFTSKYGSPTFIRNEINLIGDGEGSVLKSNGTTGYEIPNGSIYNYPVLRLGYRQFHWRYAKITNIKIDGSFSIHS